MNPLGIIMKLKNNHILWLVIILISTSALSFILSHFYPYKGLFVNLFTEIIGILFTVVFVNWIIDKKEEEKWSQVDNKIKKYLITLLNTLLGDFRVVFLIDRDQLNLKNIDPDDQYSYHKELLHIAKEIIAPNIYDKINKFKKPNWEYLDQHFSNIQDEIRNFINTYQNRLNPQEIAILLEIKDYLTKGLGLYGFTPEVFGASKEDYPELSESSWDTINKSIESTADDIKTIISLANDLSLICRDDSYR